MPKKILILGGTAEASGLARTLAERHGKNIEVTTSLAGRTKTRVPLPGKVRVGGFGGAEGLIDFMRADGTDILIDATHPFAGQISRHAEAAARTAGIPRLILVRPPWKAGPTAKIVSARGIADAARLLPGLAKRAFLTTGRGGLEPFVGVRGVHFLVRLMEPVDGPFPIPGAETFVARPPFTVDGETNLLRDNAIDTVIAKNSGGTATRAKIDAAERLGVRILMIERPDAPPGEAVGTVEAALAWIESRL